MSETAVVLLNWNGLNYLKKFLPTIVEYSKEFADIVIADNDSTDDSIKFITENFPEVFLIKLDKNYGFAEGYNKALNPLCHTYFILLNSDVEVTPNWIDPVIKSMKIDRSIAACQPKLLSYTNKQFFEYAGGAGGFIDKLGYPFCRGRLFSTLEQDTGQYNNPIELFWASGACMFVRAECFKEVKGFDGDYFAHMEEIDLCWRMKLKGYKIMYTPQSTVYHVGGGTLPKTNPQKTFLNFRNNLTTLYKNLPAHLVYQTILVRLVLDGIAGIKFLVSGNSLDCLAVIKAHFSFYKNFSKNHKKRSKSNSAMSSIYKGNIVFDYYLKGIRKFSDLKEGFR